MLNKLINYSKGFFRSFPCMVIIFSVLSSIIFQIDILLFFSIYNLIVDYLAHILKYITRWLYNTILKTKRIPLLGIGERPIGSKYCGCFINEDNLKGISSTYGMPSGHSISAMTVAIFWSMYILEKYPNNNKRLLSLLLLNSCCLLVCFSRVYLGCHTIQQVIVGSLFGMIFGYLGYKLFKILKLKNIL